MAGLLAGHGNSMHAGIPVPSLVKYPYVNPSPDVVVSRQIDAVIFDLDDTLLDWSQPSENWTNFTRPMVDNVYGYLQAQGYALPGRDAFFQQLSVQIDVVWAEAKKGWTGAQFGDALQRTFAGCGLPVDDLDLDEILRVYDWQPMEGVEPFPEAIPVLEALRARGYKLGLITNSFFPMWMRDIELDAYRMRHYFDARITSGDTGYMKPHPAIYRRALDLLNTEPQRAVFVGDRPENDILGANEAGLISVLMSPPHLNRDLKGVVPHYTIQSLSELLPILEQLG